MVEAEFEREQSEVGECLLLRLLTRQREFRDRPAMYSSTGWHFSFRELDRLTDEAAVGLSRRGVKHGDVVALALPSTPDYVVAYGALAKLGAISAGVNPKLAPPERSTLVNECAQATHVIATEPLAQPMHIDANTIEIAIADHPDALLADLRVRGESPPSLPEDRDRVVAIVFTSGTTGLPKGAVFTEQLLYNNATVDIGNGWGEGGAITGNTQFCHVGFMAKVPAQFMAGTTYHVIEPWRTDVVLDAVALSHACRRRRGSSDRAVAARSRLRQLRLQPHPSDRLRGRGGAGIVDPRSPRTFRRRLDPALCTDRDRRIGLLHLDRRARGGNALHRRPAPPGHRDADLQR